MKCQYSYLAGAGGILGKGGGDACFMSLKMFKFLRIKISFTASSNKINDATTRHTVLKAYIDKIKIFRPRDLLLFRSLSSLYSAMAPIFLSVLDWCKNGLF